MSGRLFRRGHTRLRSQRMVVGDWNDSICDQLLLNTSVIPDGVGIRRRVSCQPMQLNSRAGVGCGRVMVSITSESANVQTAPPSSV